MREVSLFKIKTPYREEVDVKGFFFGEGKKTVCFVGALRGNEIQQVYISSQLIRMLERLEAKGKLTPGCEFLVIPCINPFSMNIGKRFWPVDNTDINRMFPGYAQGETTQRIAAAVFEHIKGYKYGIQFASFYLSGDFIPHVRIMDTGYQSPELAREFALPYVLLRDPLPIDTTTLNYNWQVFETDAFSVYTKETDNIDAESAKTAVDAVLRFLNAFNFLHYRTWGGYQSEIIKESDLAAVTSPNGGFIKRMCRAGDEVEAGQVMAEVFEPLTGTLKGEITSPCSGRIFFSQKAPIVTEHETVFFLVQR